jgi:hypothetical protein
MSVLFPGVSRRKRLRGGSPARGFLLESPSRPSCGSSPSVVLVARVLEAVHVVYRIFRLDSEPLSTASRGVFRGIPELSCQSIDPRESRSIQGAFPLGGFVGVT